MVDLHKRAKMTPGEIARFLVLRSFGNFLLLFALYGVGMTFGPVLWAETQFRIAQAQGIRYRVSSSVAIAAPNNTEVTPTPEPHLPTETSLEKVLTPPDTSL